ncbi:hypothetical protein SRHO_G00188800 [Serrasalmus rhombeus]
MWFGVMTPPPLKKLLEIQWTSHFDVTNCLVQNEDVNFKVLSDVSEDSDAPVDLCTEASGLLVQMRKHHHFFEIGKFLLKVLAILKPANSILQANSVDLCKAGEVICASLSALKDLRTDESLNDLAMSESPPSKRKRTMNTQLTDSVVLSSVGHRPGDSCHTPNQSSRRSLLEILDRAIAEMENRFCRRNLDLMTAVNGLLPHDGSFLDLAILEPLQQLYSVLFGLFLTCWGRRRLANQEASLRRVIHSVSKSRLLKLLALIQQRCSPCLFMVISGASECGAGRRARCISAISGLYPGISRRFASRSLETPGARV